MALALGLNYIPVPLKMKDLPAYVDQQLDDYRRRVRLLLHFRHHDDDPSDMDLFLRPTIKATGSSMFVPPMASAPVEQYLDGVASKLHSNLNTLQRRLNASPMHSPPWLRSTLLQLKADKNIIITNADKNMGVAVVPTDLYMREGLRQLDDTNTYELLAAKPNWQAIWTEVNFILDNWNQLTVDPPFKRKDRPLSKLAGYILQLEHAEEHLRLGHLYLLWKVHKSPVVGRPIVSSINTITYHASCFVDRQLQPLLRDISSYIESSQHLIKQLHTYRFPSADCVILCADIESLYPNIPIEEGLHGFKESILHHNGGAQEIYLKHDDIDLLCALTAWVLKNNYFTFGDRMYKQIKGTAMGTPVAVVFACLFIDHIERGILDNELILAPEHTPCFYRRYIDDIFGVFPSTPAAATFMQHFNSKYPSIRCTFKIAHTSGEFLDVEVYKGEDFATTRKLSTRLFQKAQNKYLYLPPSSFHSRCVFPAFITAEIRRYRILCTDDADYIRARDNFYQRLLARGYSSSTLDPLFATTYNRADLLATLCQRYADLPARLAHQRTPIPVKIKKAPLLFKTLMTPETQALKIGPCLKPPSTNICHPDMDFLVYQRKGPLVCHQNSPSISSYFSQSRRSLHDISTLTTPPAL